MPRQVENILILQKSKSLPANLRESLRLQGYVSHTVFDIDSALALLKELRRTVLLVDCGENRHVAGQTIKHLVDTPDICDYPALIIAPSPESYKEALDRYFALVKAIDAPCGITQVMEALTGLDAAYPDYLKHIAKFAPEKLPPPAPPEAPPAADVPDRFFAQLRELALQDLSLEGHLYGRHIGEKLLLEKGFFPLDETVQTPVHELCRRLPRPDRLHLYRSAFVHGQSGKALRFDDRLREQSAGAAFLFAGALPEVNLDLLHVNYLAPEARHLRKDIGAAIKESARRAAHLNLSETGAIIHRLAELIEQSAPAGDDEQSLAASNIMAADLLDRLVYHDGYWDPQAAYLFMIKARDGALAELHPRVLPCLLKFMVESIAAKRPAFLLPRHIRTNPAAMAALKQLREQRISKREKRVDLSALTPGMKLTRPLMTPEGSVLLAGDLTLDADLIWRLWQLSTIRLLNTPLVVADRPPGAPPVRTEGKKE